MSPTLSPRLFTPTLLDPWLDLYMPAVLTEGGIFESAVEMIDHLPIEQRGNAWAITARGRLVLGRDSDAWRAFEAAQERGGDEVEALATFLVGGGAKRVAKRIATAASPGLVADAWCDAAALAMGTGETDRAVAAIAEASSVMPTHRETRHWQRYLAEPDAARAWRRAAIGYDGAPATRGLMDALHLSPRRDQGFVSPRRLTERYYPSGAAALAPKGTALAYLYDAGRSAYLLGTEPDWAAVPRSHVLATAELEIGELEDLVDEERPAGALGRAIWRAALDSGDEPRINDVGQAMCALATRAAELVSIGREAADHMAACDPKGHTMYKAYSAFLAAREGRPDALSKTLAILDLPAPGSLAFRMAIASLRTLHQPAKARKALADRKRDPVLAATARALTDETLAPIGRGILCSPRLAPRGLNLSPPA